MFAANHQPVVERPEMGSASRTVGLAACLLIPRRKPLSKVGKTAARYETRYCGMALLHSAVAVALRRQLNQGDEQCG